MKNELPPPPEDGLLAPAVGRWARDKHHFLHRYIYAFTTAMRKKQWSSLHYIDLFAGAGVTRIETSGKLEWSSSLIAAQTSYPFDRLHLCEQDPEKFAALSKRLKCLHPNHGHQVLNGDANALVKEVVQEIPAGSLSLAFLDPTGLHLDFETLRTLSNVRADLIVFFPDRLDILRNWKAYYWGNPNSNLDRVFGKHANWRKTIAETHPNQQLAEFRRLYIDRIKTLGYVSFGTERIPSTGRPLYLLIFCSRVKLGGDIWRRVSKRKPDWQDTFDFGAP